MQVLSVTLDDWSNDEIDAMVEVGGNASANSIYEAYFPEGVQKPAPDASHDERSKFIRLFDKSSWSSFHLILHIRRLFLVVKSAYFVSQLMFSFFFSLLLLCFNFNFAFAEKMC